MPKQIIRNQAIVEDDWQHLDDDQTLPASGKVIVGWARWEENRETLKQRGDLGVRITGDVDAHALAHDHRYFDLIALEFPAFADGRCYSHARLLRERFGYERELRAIGDVLRDQLFYMHRCGINAFEVRDDKDIEDALKAFEDFDVAYQPAVNAPRRAYRRFRAGERAA